MRSGRGNVLFLAGLLTALGMGGAAVQAATVKLVAPAMALHAAAVGQSSPLAAGICQEIGGIDQALPLLQFQYRANVFRVERTSELQEIRFEMAFAGSAEMSFSVHRAELGSNVFEPIYIGPVLTKTAPVCQNPPCQGMFSSGIISNEDGVPTPVLLQEGFDYAIGVLWGSTSVRVYRDVQNYPVPFSDGLVRGSTGIPYGAGPPFGDDISLRITPFSGGAWSMQLCIVPKPGACCLAGGVCNDTLVEADCLQMGGKFTEPLLTCAALAEDPEIGGCPLPLWVCCLGEQCIPSLDRFSCEDLDGRWEPNVQSCASMPCLPLGACCKPDGTCEDLPEEDCIADPLNGVFQGDNTSCFEVDATCGIGACCADDVCVEVSRAACAGIPGVWGGNGTTCQVDSCDPVGACCQGTTCEVLTRVACQAAGGAYQGDWSNCEALPVQCGRGACCRASGCLDDVTQSTCNVFSGDYQGVGTKCSELNPSCPAPCCLGNECVDDVDAQTCGEVEGLFPGYGDACPFFVGDPDPCDPATHTFRGGCCIAGESCVDVVSDTSASQVCMSLGGAYLGDGVLCANSTCPPPPAVGGCCLSGGGCADLTAEACATEEGTYQGDNVFCTLALCATGACCHLSGTCDDHVSFANCTGPGDAFFDGLMCSDATVQEECAPKACCSLGNCSLLTQRGCAFVGGKFDPYADTCDDLTVCETGACCLKTGSCSANRIRAGCEGDPSTSFDNLGVFIAGGTCPNAQCEPGGACCADGQCQQLTQTACQSIANSAFAGVGQACTSGLCSLGACCGPTGADDCIEQPRFVCEADPDNAFLSGFDCNDDVCPAAGACCVGTTCSVVTDLACINAQGTFEGVDTTCSPNPCDVGACCLGNGLCVNLSRPDCDGQGGTLIVGATCAQNPCPPATACCINESCSLRTRVNCEAAGGIHAPGVAACNSSVCDEGACCLDDGCCIQNVIEDTCVNGLGGVEFTEGASCTAANCLPVEATGSCCINGQCTVVTEAECGSQNGFYRGDGTACTPGACILGACCSFDGTCVDDVIAVQCAGADDIFRPGFDCANFTCFERGACCRDDVCTNGETVATCVAPDVFGGGGSTCSPDACEVGACCLDAQVGQQICQTRSRLGCDLGGGHFLGTGTTCPTDECIIGSCCTADGGCLDGQVADQCDAEFGVFAAQTCSARTCTPRGACCSDDAQLGEICVVRTLQECTNATVNGAFAGAGESCTPDLCVTGACCLAAGGCAEQTRLDCETGLGLYEGAGTLCGETGICSTGACCGIDGTCTAGQREGDCLAGGGSYLAGSACSPNPCSPAGACYIFEGGCQKLTQAACDTAAGNYQGDGTNCPANPPCAPGACELGDECALLTLTDCIALGGTFSQPGEVCPRGACCLPDEQCVEITREQCVLDGGSYAGDGTNCFDDYCSMGGCCLSDGTCQDLSGAECAERDGQFNDDIACDQLACPAPGACCIIGATCQEIADFACAAAGGSFIGAGVACSPDPCEIGACCRTNGTCVNTTESDCLTNEAGQFFSGQDCDVDPPCPPAGACCVPAVGCQVLTEAACSAAGGSYEGDGTLCTPDPCIPTGACCNGAVCTETTEADCVSGGGIYNGDGVLCAPGLCGGGGLMIMGSDPESDSIDAGQPHPVSDNSTLQGWETVTIAFNGDATGVVEADFAVTEVSGGVTDEIAPDIATATVVLGDPNSVNILFDAPIEPRAWTVIEYLPSGDKICLGYLPGDVNSSRGTNVQDITALIDSLNNVVVYPSYATDVNRSNATNVQDITALIDLLNGAEQFDPWNAATLIASPCP